MAACMNSSTTSSVYSYSTLTTCSSASFPKPILKRSDSGASVVSSGSRNHRNPFHRVHFVGLDSDEQEEVRSRKGQAMRKRMNQKMVRQRLKRAREHEERKRIFDILKSKLPTVKELMLEIVCHDTSPGMLFTRALHGLLEALGAPPGCHVLIQLEWLRRQRIEYTKRLRNEVERLDDYLYYIASSDAFKERFVWENPFEINRWRPTSPTVTSSSSCTTENCIPAVLSLPSSGSHIADKSIETSIRGPRRWRRFFRSIFQCVAWSVRLQRLMGDNHDAGSQKQQTADMYTYSRCSSHESYHYYTPQEDWATKKVQQMDEYESIVIPARVVVGIYA